MRILQIAHKSPYPSIDGASLAIQAISNGILDLGHQLHVIAMHTPKQFCNLDEVPGDFIKRTRFQLGYIDNRIKVIPAFLNLFSSTSYNISRFHTKEFEALVTQSLEHNKYDLILLDSLFVTPYLPVIRKLSKAKVILRPHNVEYTIWENLRKNEGNILKKLYLGLLIKRLKKYELDTFEGVDGITAISSLDEKQAGLLTQTPVCCINFGLDFKKDRFKTTQAVSPENMTAFHLGSMDWLPHVEAIEWLMQEVWPKVLAINPDAKLHLAGRNMPQRFFDFEKLKGVSVTGAVYNPVEFMRNKALMLVPSFSGGGVRIKII